MAVCLDYQTVYARRERRFVSVRAQLCAGILLLVALGVKVWVKIETVDLGYQLARERDVALEFDMERRELELQRSVLLRPDTLAKAANDKLGLRPMARHQVTRLQY